MSRVLRTVAAAATTVLLAAGSAQATDGESIHLSWDGATYSEVTTASFLGAPVAAPGDSASRTVLVRNDGPATGTLRASIVNVDLLDPGAADVHHETGQDEASFYDDLVLRWPGGSASFTELAANGATPVLEVALAQGREVPVTLGYELPEPTTSGNRANVLPRRASFDVLLEIGAELPEDPEPGPGATPGRLQETGAGVGPLVGLACLATVLGAALARRRTTAGPPPGH